MRNDGALAGLAGRRRRRGAGARRVGADRAARPGAARAGAARPRPARRRLRAADGGGGGDARPGDREEGAAHAPADRAVRALRGAARAAGAGGGGGVERSCSRSTAATPRPTSRWSARTAGCSRSRAGRRARPTISARTAACACSQGWSRRPGSTAGSPPSRRSAWPASTSRARRSDWPSSSTRAAGRERTTVLNDTFAVLRAGTEDGWGVAVVCGAGINCVGVAPDGRQVRFPALGAITGDWGGGFDVGLAARLERGAQLRRPRPRRPRSSEAVPAHYGLRDAVRAGRGDPPRRRSRSAGCWSSPPIVFAEAEHDEVAAEIVDRLATRWSRWRATALSRLGLETAPVEVLLGGGLLSGENSRVVERIRAGLHERSPVASVQVTGTPPIVGATLLALDALGAGPAAQAARPCRGDGGGRGERWLRCTSGRRHAIYPGNDAAGGRRASTSTSPTASSWCSSGRRARARPPRCGCSPASRRSTRGAIYIGDRDVTVPRARRIATWRWSSRTTRSTRT